MYNEEMNRFREKILKNVSKNRKWRFIYTTN